MQQRKATDINVQFWLRLGDTGYFIFFNTQFHQTLVENSLLSDGLTKGGPLSKENRVSQTLFGNPKGSVELGNPNTCAETKVDLNFILFRLKK